MWFVLSKHCLPSFVHGPQSKESELRNALLKENGVDGDVIGTDGFSKVVEESRRVQHVQNAQSVAAGANSYERII